MSRARNPGLRTPTGETLLERGRGAWAFVLVYA